MNVKDKKEPDTIEEQIEHAERVTEYLVNSRSVDTVMRSCVEGNYYYYNQRY